MTPTKKPAEHLKSALSLIMSAAGTPHELMFFFTTAIIHIHDLCKGGDNDEEAEFRIDPSNPENDHHYSCILFLKGVVFPWASENCKEPSKNMIEGMEGMMSLFAAEGWANMVSALYVPICRDLSQGGTTMKGIHDVLRIHAALTQTIPILLKYMEAKDNPLSKAA